jgi:type II secretory pathway pseudopilin PulG
MRKRSGFTIVELMIVGGVVFILLNGMTLMLSETGRQIWQRTDVQMVTIQDAQLAMDRLTRDLRRASQTGLQCPTAAAGDCTTPPCLEFNMDPDGPGGAAAQAIVYQRTGGNALTRMVDGVGPELIAGNLQGFQPRCVTATGVVELHVTAQVMTAHGPSQQTLHSTVRIQNP